MVRHDVSRMNWGEARKAKMYYSEFECGIGFYLMGNMWTLS